MAWLDGCTIDPPVSLPTLAAHKLAAVPAPELDPPGLRTARPSPLSRGSGRGSYGLNPNPLTALYAAIGVGAPATQFASSISVVFAIRIAPASRRLRVSVASYGGIRLVNASAPPVV